MRINNLLPILLSLMMFGMIPTHQSFAALEYTNPVIDEINLADPAIVRYEGKYYLYPTGDTVGYHVYISTNLVD